MTATTRTVGQALNAANALLTPLQTDARLDGAAQALVGELIQANTLAINALRADNTIIAGQRTARAQQIEDKVGANMTVERAHESDIPVTAYYDALDLSADSALCIRQGVGSFITDLGGP